MSMARRIK